MIKRSGTEFDFTGHRLKEQSRKHESDYDGYVLEESIDRDLEYFGTSYRAQAQGEAVAVKVYEKADNKNTARLIENGARIIQEVDDHPNIPSVRSFGRATIESANFLESIIKRKRQALITDYVGDDSLFSYSRRGMPTAEAVRLGVSLAEALAHVHDKGYVHLDVRGGSVRVDQHEQLHLTNFEMAKQIGEQGSGGGTFLSSAPEQLIDSPRTPAMDVYAWGVEVYRLLAEYPSRNLKTLELDETVREALLMRYSMSLDQIPQSLLNIEEIIHSSLEVDPAKRPKDMKTIATELRERYLTGLEQDRAQPLPAGKFIMGYNGLGDVLTGDFTATDKKGELGRRHNESIASLQANTSAQPVELVRATKKLEQTEEGSQEDEPIVAPLVIPRRTGFSGHTLHESGRNFHKGYRLDELIANGGFGAVYKAIDLDKQDKPLAIKLGDQFDSAEEQQQFELEASRSVRLRHEHVLSVYVGGMGRIALAGVAIERPMMVMELAHGSLAEKITRCRKGMGEITVREAVEISSQASDGVEYIHNQGMIHRDLKPANLLFDKEGVLKVADIGIATELHHAHSQRIPTQLIMGTLEYMPPEQAKGKAVRESDIYAMGAILYELVTGKRVIQGHDLVSLLYAQMSQEPVPFENVPGVAMTKELEAIEPLVRTALEKDPRDRPKQISEWSYSIRGAYERAKAESQKEKKTFDL